jgi:small subunit ribosomal protein S27Ae
VAKGKVAKGENAKSKFYTVEGDKLTHLKQNCPRCGPGVFMAEHGNRLACGKCGYTDFKK